MPIIVEVVDATTAETTVVDILLGAIGLTGALMLGALVLGLAFGGLLIAVKRVRGRTERATDRSTHVELGLTDSAPQP
jgi:hypothetical protein